MKGTAIRCGRGGISGTYDVRVAEHPRSRAANGHAGDWTARSHRRKKLGHEESQPEREPPWAMRSHRSWTTRSHIRKRLGSHIRRESHTRREEVRAKDLDHEESKSRGEHLRRRTSSTSCKHNAAEHLRWMRDLIRYIYLEM